MKNTAKVTMEHILHKDNLSLESFLDSLQTLLHCNYVSIEPITSELIDLDFLDEVNRSNRPIFFGKTLRELKCLLSDEAGLREHEIIMKYKGCKQLSILSLNMPHSALQDREYDSIEEVVNSVQHHVNNLQDYFRELDQIDRYCTVVEPVKPTYKEDYRRILLDNRTWLHVEVTPEGMGTNIHLVGQSSHWQDKLQSGLLNWDHDKDVVENIMIIFDITDFPVLENKSTAAADTVPESKPAKAITCSICLCDTLPDDPGVPQPLCQNTTCGVYFHNNCLYQWLVACGGGRPPAFGVATGSCPSCLQLIVCNEKDN